MSQMTPEAPGTAQSGTIRATCGAPRLFLLIAALILLPACSHSRLFNGRDLAGWQGLVEPPLRAALSSQDLAACQAAADQIMRDHWSAQAGVLVFDGRGQNLCTIESFRDFDLELDWKIEPRGDSGIYLRGTPQVQIWDNPVGSGGLYNNKHHASVPMAVADRPPGQWNHFRIRMVGERVSVWLNGTLVVDDTPLENYWYPGRPIFCEGPVELQSHGDRLYFRNVFIKRL